MKQEEVSNFLIEERGGHLLSLYLAGSRTNSSRVEDSDWDFFGLVNDDFSQEKEDEINYMLERNFKQEVNFRAIYISELEGGKQKGILTKYIPVEILVKAMPQWEHIDGEKYSQEDFKIKPATPSEEIEFYIGRLKDFRQKAKIQICPSNSVTVLKQF